MKRYLLIIGVLLSCLSLRAQSVNYTCRYWFDQDFGQATTATFNSSTWQAYIDVGFLPEGPHSLHIHVMDTSMMWSAPLSYLFIKLAETQSADMTYHLWFDQDHYAIQSGYLGNGHLLFDVSDMEEGLHTVNIMLEGSTYTSVQSYVFMRMAVEMPTTEVQYHFWFDQDYSNVQTGLLGSGIFEIEVGNLPTGLHTLNVQLDNGTLDAPHCYLFFKQPMGGNGLARWEYWLNGNISDRQTINVIPSVDTLDIISLLQVGHHDIRSSCFHFHPNGDNPYINAKNEITFRFWDNDHRFFDKSAYYVDEQVQQDVVASVFERNTTETIAAPRDNQIQWFKLDAVVGDSLACVANKACTMQLFAPSGEEVYSATASEAMTIGGCHAWEDGTYYLAVHDVTGSGETIDVTYQYLDKYVVLAYTPSEIGNTWGVFEFDVLGNGFDKLSNAILVNGSIEWQMDTIMYSHISEGAIRFAMDSTTVNGDYDIKLCFEDQDGELDTLTLANALHVADAEFGTIDINYSYQFNTTPPYLITVNITNNGNVEYQGVPIMFAHTNVDNVHFELYNDWISVQEDYFENGGQAIYYTTNFLNHGTEGNIIPLIIPKLASHGTRQIILNVDAPRGSEFDFYAWGGIPWSLKTDQAYAADGYYCQTHPSSPGWGGNHSGGNGGNSGSANGGGSSGSANFTVGTYNNAGGNSHGSASDAFYDSCDGPPDPCDIAGHLGGSVQECLCGVTMGLGNTLGNMLNAMHGLNHRRQLDGVGIKSQADAEAAGPALEAMWNSAYQRRLRSPGSLLREAVGHCTGMLPEGAQQAANAGLQGWGMLDDDCPDPPHQRPSIPRPCEPNEIRGYLAESGSHFMMQDIQTITYEIESENDTTATAAAHTIIVRDTLDVNKFDVSSLAAYRVTIHDKVLELNGEHNFVYTLDLRPNVYVIAQIQQECDDETGIVVWTITSLDPMTMEPTDDPNQGALPINYNGEGIATFTYNVNLKEPFPDGTEINNRVGIIFDLEEVVLTDTWTNIIDAVKPTSTIADVTQEADTLNFIFTSEDNRSGIWYHTLYYRNDSTEMEWKVKKSQILENNYIMTLDDLQVTEYFVLATDSAGNREEKDFIAEYIYLPDNMTLQSTTLVQGWNWWSTYVEQNDVEGLQMMENSLGNNGLTIKSQDEFTTNYFETIGYNYWYGGLESVDNEQGYMINTNTTCNVKMIGVPASPSDHPITLTPNWNWIGYPVNQAQLLSVSLGGFQPEDNDVMKSHSGFATYYDGYGWYPDDFIMTPGEGYLYKSNASANKSLTYVLNRDVLPEKTTIDERYWTPVINKYAGNISVIAVVEASGVELRDNVEIAAFVDGECRGSAILRYFEPTDRYYAMLSIVGENEDVVNFEMLGSNSDLHITFQTDDVLGSLDKPLVISFSSHADDLAVYPNPVDKNQEFSLVIPQWEKASEILITNALGENVRKESIVDSTVKGFDTSGIYMVKIICASGNVYMNKLIVK